MSVLTFDHETDIAVDALTVWCTIADYSNDTRWRTGVRSMTADPGGLVWVGTTTAETMTLAGRSWHNAGVITAVTPSSRFEWRTVDGARASGARSVTPMGTTSCRVRLELTVEPTGLSHVLAPYLRRLLDANLRQDLERLRALLTGPTSQ